MGVVDHASASRIADAATLMLDAARELAKKGPGYVPGTTNEKATLALAVQALIVADHFPHSGPVFGPMPEGYTDRWIGVATGLGAAIGTVSDRTAPNLALILAVKAMGSGADMAAAAMKKAHP